MEKGSKTVLITQDSCENYLLTEIQIISKHNGGANSELHLATKIRVQVVECLYPPRNGT